MNSMKSKIIFISILLVLISSMGVVVAHSGPEPCDHVNDEISVIEDAKNSGINELANSGNEVPNFNKDQTNSSNVTENQEDNLTDNVGLESSGISFNTILIIVIIVIVIIGVIVFILKSGILK